ncbi:hypothetical protein [Candidatus Enterococcus leclercqii]|uniref:hypothetical protein n=1 Tax=Enterococcus TaxID=1350 RepID=UPI00137A2DBA|nr:hypothetical protein [Enterococcus sp. CU9D]KAF1291331.1 hypothetical protein BAU14_00365 [Enterococcus sp. CU9D]
MKGTKYTVRTVIAGILFYFILSLLFPKMNLLVQILCAFAFFFAILWFIPGVRKFFIGPPDK